ncbi:MAG: hypothetical protein MZV65_37825 [Chromatiales bacterium]|nr:hypothetical protein [Chromatiales bacterium]
MTEGESLLSTVRKALEGLKRTEEGASLHGLIARGLRRFETTPIAPAFIAFIDRLFDRYLATPDSDPATRVRVKVIQQRLKPYLELTAEEFTPPAAARETAAPVAARRPPPAPATSAPATTAAPPPAAESLPAQLAREMTVTLERQRGSR